MKDHTSPRMKKAPGRRPPATRPTKEPPTERTFTLGAVFAPDGGTPGSEATTRFGSRVADMKAFLEFWTEATAEILSRKKRQLRTREAELNKQERQWTALLKAQPEVNRIMQDASADRISTAAAARRIKRLVPDRAVAEILFDIYSAAAKSTPIQPANKTPQPAVTDADIAPDAAGLAKTQRLAGASLAINDAISTLWQAAEAGDLEATKHLAEVAILATTFLFRMEQTHPEITRLAARGQVLWPVLAKDKPTWAAEAARRVAALDLGAGLEPLRIRFRKARGHDDNWPARQWAKGAVRTIEETRLRIVQFGEVLRRFDTHEALVGWCMATGWRGPQEQPWVDSVAKLPPLTIKCLSQWKAAIRELIRAQIPDFHLHSAWSNQRLGARLTGRNTKGVIQSRILDDICDALETLVPAARDNASRNSEAEIRQPSPDDWNPTHQVGEARAPNPLLNGGHDKDKTNYSGNGK